MRIYLTGFMGSGKTTVGRILAQQLGWDFFDLDQEIERKAGNTIAAIFATSGEAVFRKWETDCLHAMTQDSAVIATGGGCFVQHAEWMLKNGFVVYLQVPFELLAARIGADPSRPLWKNAQKLFEERQQVYGKAHWTVDASRSPEKIATEIRRSSRVIEAVKRIPED